MKIHTIESKVSIAAPIEAVYGFHLETKNLPLISPPSMKAELIKESGEALGKEIELKITQFGAFSSIWVVRIEEYEPPFKLTDLALQSPFPYFKHTRHFSQPCAAVTELRDVIEYALPFGAVGELANKLSIEKMIREMFEYREQRTKEILEEKFYIKEVPVS